MSRLARLTYIQRNQRKVIGNAKNIIINVDNVLQFEQLEDQEDGANYLVKYDTHGLVRDNKVEIFRCTEISDNFIQEIPTCSLLLVVLLKENIRRVDKVVHIPTSYFIYAEPLVDYNYLSMSKVFSDGSNDTGDNNFMEYLITAGLDDLEQSCAFGITESNPAVQNKVYNIEGLTEITVPQADVAPFGEYGVFQLFMAKGSVIELTDCSVEVDNVTGNVTVSWGDVATVKSFLVLT